MTTLFDYAFRRLWLEVGITRTTVKQDVMTYFYSRTAYGMADRRIATRSAWSKSPST